MVRVTTIRKWLFDITHLNGEDPADFAQPAHDPPVVYRVKDTRLFLVVHMAKAGEQEEVKQGDSLQAPDAQKDVVRPKDLCGGNATTTQGYPCCAPVSGWWG